MRKIFAVIGICWSVGVLSQPVQKMTPEEYIEKFKAIAINEMHRTGIPASITLAQGILESGSGNSRLAREANNHFGIKCHRGWTGPSIREDDDAPDECFRKYHNAYKSYVDHSTFLMTRDRYAFLFTYDRTDYKRWAHGLKKAGYATNPQYGPLLIRLIERYNLHQYDLHPPIPELAYDPAGDQPPPEPGALTYPTDMLEINRIEAIYYQPGMDLVQVAAQEGIRLRKLKKWNDLDEGYQLEPGMYLFLQPKRNKGANRYHLVATGETMYQIAQRYGIKIHKLYKRNRMEMGQQPAAGERLRLRGRRKSPPRLRPVDTTPDPVPQEKQPTTTLDNETVDPYEELHKTAPVSPSVPADTLSSGGTTSPQQDIEASPMTEKHTVAQGETLYSISRMYDVSVEEIRQWNELSGDTIHIGQQLLLHPPK